MTTLPHAQDAGTKAKRFTMGSNARAIAFVVAIIGTVTIAPFALLSRAHFAPSLAKDLRHCWRLWCRFRAEPRRRAPG